MTNKLTEQAELLAATLGITTKEAAEMLEEQRVIECIDPFTGTVELMVIRGRDE